MTRRHKYFREIDVDEHLELLTHKSSSNDSDQNRRLLPLQRFSTFSILNTPFTAMMSESNAKTKILGSDKNNEDISKTDTSKAIPRLFISLNDTICQMEGLSFNISTAKHTRPSINDCLSELLNIRMKLVNEPFRAQIENSTLPDITSSSAIAGPEPSSDIDIDHQNGIISIVCIYCHSTNHSPELCSQKTSTNQRIRFLAKNNRCFRCLLTLSDHLIDKCVKVCLKCNGNHHVSICRKQTNPHALIETEASPKKMKSALLVEPPLPDGQFLRRVARPIYHPLNAKVQFPFKHGQEGNYYSQLVTVKVQSDVKESNLIARALINLNKCDVSLVSPQLLAKLRITSTKIKPKPIPLEQSSFTLNSYANLNLSSIHRDGFHYQRPFYVFGSLSTYRVSTASQQLKALAKQRGILLHGETHVKGHKDIDLVLGRDQAELLGIDFTKGYVHLCTKTEFANAYYTHFGYCLIGKRKMAKKETNKNKSPDGNKAVIQDNKNKIEESNDASQQPNA